MAGRGVDVPEAVGTTTRSERHTPRPGTTDDVEVPLQLAATHEPARNTCEALEHARQLPGPEPEQLEQLASQDWQVEDVLSKNCVLLHVGKHLPFVRTGRLEEQLEHWEKEGPEQVAQSGWQVVHTPEFEVVKELDGQEETHFPREASWLLEQVRQNVELPAQVVQEESQAVHVRLSVGERKVPAGQLGTHFPCERTKPGKQPVHWAWSIVDATEKFGIWHVVHFGPQARKVISNRTKIIKKFTLTITFLLVVICDQIRACTHTISICSHTSAIK